MVKLLKICGLFLCAPYFIRGFTWLFETVLNIYSKMRFSNPPWPPGFTVLLVVTIIFVILPSIVVVHSGQAISWLWKTGKAISLEKKGQSNEA